MAITSLARAALMLACGVAACAAARAEGAAARDPIAQAVDATIRPLMAEHDIPGMAVAVTGNGDRRVLTYGVASTESRRPVTDATLFEIGSLSKTFTATLAAYARERGALSFSDAASKHMPALAGTSFDHVSLLELGTYAAGCLPLQFPDDVAGDSAMVDFYRRWRPACAIGEMRLYSNPSIGLFGHLAARSMGEPFDVLVERRLLPMLGLTSTYLRVPESRLADYAFGTSKPGRPVRVNPGVLDAEAYGVKTTASDMLRFVEANIDASDLEPELRRAIAATQTGYLRVGDMIQGLGWEMYDPPAPLDRLLAGNSEMMALQPQRAQRLDPPLPPGADRLVNKTGSTNGFGAYAAFFPGRRLGVVLLANRNYPIAARVAAARRILSALGEEAAAER